MLCFPEMNDMSEHTDQWRSLWSGSKAAETLSANQEFPA